MGPNKKSNLEYFGTVIVALVSIALGGLKYHNVLKIRKAYSAINSSCTPTDLQSVDVSDGPQLLHLLGRAAKCSDIDLAHFVKKEIIRTNNPSLMICAGDMVYSTSAPGLMELKLSLFQAAYDLTVSSNGEKSPKDHDDVNAYRLATYWLGLGLEESGDDSAAKRLYEKSVKQGLWNVPEQRPMPYFHFIPSGDPFPPVSDYAEIVKILEDNYQLIKEELILQKRFPGHLYAQSETVVYDGKWIYGRFYEEGVWFEDYINLFPNTFKVLKEIQDKFGHDLPVASTRLSTMDQGTTIRPHCGSGNHKVRVHLPLYVPRKCEMFGTFFCGIQAGNEKRSYKEGKVFILDDSYVHHVWNRSSEPRSVLFVDVWIKGISEEKKERVRNHFVQYKGDRGSGEISNLNIQDYVKSNLI